MTENKYKAGDRVVGNYRAMYAIRGLGGVVTGRYDHEAVVVDFDNGAKGWTAMEFELDQEGGDS